MDAYRIANSGAEGGYDGGDGFHSRSPDGGFFEATNDLFFRTFVEVPEPGAVIPLIAGLAMIGFARRRRARR